MLYDRRYRMYYVSAPFRENRSTGSLDAVGLRPGADVASYPLDATEFIPAGAMAAGERIAWNYYDPKVYPGQIKFVYRE